MNHSEEKATKELRGAEEAQPSYKSNVKEVPKGRFAAWNWKTHTEVQVHTSPPATHTSLYNVQWLRLESRVIQWASRQIKQHLDVVENIVQVIKVWTRVQNGAYLGMERPNELVYWEQARASEVQCQADGLIQQRVPRHIVKYNDLHKLSLLNDGPFGGMSNQRKLSTFLFRTHRLSYLTPFNLTPHTITRHTSQDTLHHTSPPLNGTHVSRRANVRVSKVLPIRPVLSLSLVSRNDCGACFLSVTND